MTSLREQILHAAREQEYNPAARRERYLRERKLKGRRAGGFQQPQGDKGSIKPIKTDQADGPRSDAPTPVTPARVEALKVRLAELKIVLANLVEEAKRAAGVETAPESNKDSTKTADTKPEKKTAAEKKDDAKAAKERRDKEPSKAPKETASSVQTQIEAIRKQISDMRENLARVRKQGSKKPPPKPTPGWNDANDNKPIKRPTALEGRQN